MDFIFELIGLYLLYKLIFDFIIPISESTKQVRRQFSDLQNKMQEQSRAFDKQKQSGSQPVFKANSTTSSQDDYIEFEEVK